MIIQQFIIKCDSCEYEYNESFDTISSLLKNAKKIGWVEKDIQNGIILAFCPKCVKEGKHEETK